jgi:hypothetical protein
MFKTVVDGFDQVYRWLGFIFDWGDIQRSKNAIKYLMNQGIDYSVSVVQQLRTVVDRAFPAFQSDLHQRFINFASQIIGEQTSIAGYRAAHPVPEDVERKVDDASSTNIVQQSMLNHMGQVNLGAPKLSVAASANALAAAEGAGDAINQMIAKFQTIGTQSQSADAFKRAGAYFASIKDHPEQILQRTFAGLIEVCDGLTQLALDLVHTFVDLVFDAIALAMTEVKNLLNAAWSIPVVSQLYARYFGGELSTLDLIALSIAVPGTALYKILFSAAPFPDEPSEKAFEALLTTAEMQRLSGWPPRSAADVARAAPGTDDPPPVLTAPAWTVVNKIVGTFQAVCRGLFIIPDTLLDVLPATANVNKIGVINSWALGLEIAGFLTAIPWRDGRPIAPGCETDDAVERLGWLLGLIPVGVDCGFYFNEVRQNRPGAIARNLEVPGAVATAACGLLGMIMTITWALKNEGKDAKGIAGGIIDGLPGVLKWVPQLLPLGPPRVIGKVALGALDVACGATAVGLSLAGLFEEEPA